MAEALAAQTLAARLGCRAGDLPDRGVIVESAGTAGGFGGAASHAITVLGKRGIDLSGHVSSPLLAEKIHQADYIYAMTRSHREAVLDIDSSAEDRVTLLLGDCDIRDPIGGSESDYASCVAEIEEGLQVALKEIQL
jgi:protein-tyrosine phosphatase